jgi:hypothetical protein
VNISSPEICNSLDDDCNGAIDEGLQQTFFADYDGDGFGDPASYIFSCSLPDGYVPNNTDCNDANSNIRPSATEICNGLDDDCDGALDETGVTVAVSPYGTVSICKKVKLTFTANTSGTVTSYQWKKNGNNIAGATNSTYLTNESESGTYSVHVTGNSGCTALSAGTVMTRLNSPTATITATGNLNICQLGNVTLKANTGTGLTYQWLKDNVSIAGATTSKHKATQTGSYTVIVTNSSGCSATSLPALVISVCRDEVAASPPAPEVQWNIAPNPNRGSFEVLFESPLPAGTTVRVYDLTGKITLEQQMEVETIALPVQLREATAGLYLIEWRNAVASGIRKFMVTEE